MRYLGIDYGKKNTGLAVSDEEGRVAFPFKTLKTQNNLLDEILKIVETEKIGLIVIGESKDFQNNDNPIMAEIRIFAEKVKEKLGREVIFQPEYLTSREAERVPDGQDSEVDSRAAALILGSYLERKNRL